ncbi:MAG: hypothetical protein UV60_C0004G0019 [Parcubacteria group bacterium GW2011_GWA2_43_11]|nr:MAG: hypothetical protein UU89_C0008G0011 [Parcubacteria group bacterium GW2011_GWC2_42_11]KKS85942.1 MAG: hypothetical protein UV60_C0004G0019 [Parcubacteria group bacterium GW2011_GWA2_43_11]
MHAGNEIFFINRKKEGGIRMGINTKEMSIALGLPEKKLKDILGVAAYVTCHEEACTAYVEAIRRNGESIMGRKSAFECLCSFTETFSQALKGYLIAPNPSAEKDALLDLCLGLFSHFQEADKLRHFAKKVPGHEDIVIKKMANFFRS